jgi:hypothetical protein
MRCSERRIIAIAPLQPGFWNLKTPSFLLAISVLFCDETGLMKGGNLIRALIVMMGLGGVSVPAATNETPLATLYQAFLSGSNRSGYVTFDRISNYPPLPARNPAIGNASRASSSTNFVCFSWDGPRFAVAESPVEPPGRPGSGMRWYGYDGTNYWQVSFDNAVTYARGDRELATPLASSSSLLVIPISETNNLPGRSAVSRIANRAEECRRVVQFGFSNPMEGKPHVRGDTLTVEGEGRQSETLKFQGSIERPERFDPWPASNSLPRIRAVLDFQRNGLGIEKLTSGGSHFIYSNQYVLATVQISEPAVTNGVFSWQAHKPVGRLNVVLFKAGAGVLAEITPAGEVRPTVSQRRTGSPQGSPVPSPN